MTFSLRIVIAVLVASFLIPLGSALASFTPPPFRPNVVDDTQTLTAREIEELNLQIQDLQSKGVMAAVYVTQTTGHDSIESAAEKTFRFWKLGEAGKDNGLLFIFALEDRRARIEVGYGLEGEIPDVLAKAILDEVILPKFKAGNYGEGIQAGLTTIGAASEGQDLSHLHLRADEDVEWSQSLRYWGWWTALVWLMPALVRNLRKQRSRDDLIYRLHLNKGDGWIVKPFLTFNPGIFIAVFGPMVAADLEPSLVSNFLTDTLLPFFLQTLLIALFIFSIGAIVKMTFFKLGHARSTRNPDHRRKGLNLRLFLADLDNLPLVIGAIILSLLMSLIWLLSDEMPEAVMAVSFAVTLLVAAFKMIECRPLLSDAAYLRSRAKKRLQRIKTRTEGTREIFGKKYSYTRPSSTSSSGSGFSTSSSSSFSSSSGGGRSGGGGASSSW